MKTRHRISKLLCSIGIHRFEAIGPDQQKDGHALFICARCPRKPLSMATVDMEDPWWR